MPVEPTTAKYEITSPSKLQASPFKNLQHHSGDSTEDNEGTQALLGSTADNSGRAVGTGAAPVAGIGCWAAGLRAARGPDTDLGAAGSGLGFGDAGAVAGAVVVVSAAGLGWLRNGNNCLGVVDGGLGRVERGRSGPLPPLPPLAEVLVGLGAGVLVSTAETGQMVMYRGRVTVVTLPTEQLVTVGWQLVMVRVEVVYTVEVVISTEEAIVELGHLVDKLGTEVEKVTGTWVETVGTVESEALEAMLTLTEPALLDTVLKVELDDFQVEVFLTDLDVDEAFVLGVAEAVEISDLDVDEAFVLGVAEAVEISDLDVDEAFVLGVAEAVEISDLDVEDDAMVVAVVEVEVVLGASWLKMRIS
ncbi:hypothetical protein E5D57_008745 [Metarhizium anisopliae]|nr:hypothetical protein E5D57_008745 [Metarhizium anisopliae]